MAKYGNGISFAEACKMNREELLHALNGEIRVGENENGFIYAPASKEETDKVIIGLFDSLVYDAQNTLKASRAMESAYFKQAGPLPLKDFMSAMEAENE